MTKETYVRLSRDIDGVEHEWSPRERYMLFVRGFRDGCAVKAMRRDCVGLGAYDRGYAEGRASANVAVAAYAAEIGYEPTVLRTTSAKDVKP